MKGHSSELAPKVSLGVTTGRDVLKAANWVELSQRPLS